MPSPIVTLVVHGTFAGEETWWKRGSGEFADQLEARLTGRGLEGTTWQPVIDAGMSYDDFAWSGRNRHKDRIAGAAAIAESLGRLAEHHEATTAEPLQVNLVAHSHGGNVALELLNKLPATVRVHRLVMLGTPLVWRRGTGRILAIAASLLGFIWLVSQQFSALFADEPTATPSNAEVFGFTLFLVIVLPLLLGPYLMVIERPFVWGDRLFAWLLSLIRRGGPKGIPAYGPREDKLGRLVDAPPTLVISKEDEADLVLHMGASPRDVYDALVKRADLSGRMRFVEFFFIRGPFSVLVTPAAEALTEHFVLGFGARKVLFNDYEMVDLSDDNKYVSSDDGAAIRRRNVSDELVPALRERLSQWRPTAVLLEAGTGDLSDRDRHIETMRALIRGVGTDLKNQMQLRHTVYYETEAVVELVADLLTADA